MNLATKLLLFLASTLSWSYDQNFFSDIEPKIWEISGNQLIISGDASRGAHSQFQFYGDLVEGPTPLNIYNQPTDFPLVARAGKTLRVLYLSNNLVHLRDVAELFVYLRLENGHQEIMKAEKTFYNGGTMPPSFEAFVKIPPWLHGKMDLWFEIRTHDGRSLWDSQNGKNYPVQIIGQEGSVVRFDLNYNHRSSRALIAGESLFVAYDISRIFHKLGGTSYNGGATFKIESFVKFVDGHGNEISRFSQTVSWSLGEHRNMLAAFVSPKNARGVEFWFRGSSRAGTIYDSNWSKNFYYGISP